MYNVTVFIVYGQFSKTDLAIIKNVLTSKKGNGKIIEFKQQNFDSNISFD